MAQPIPCDICGQTTADFVITAVANGDTLGVGVECVSAWAEVIVRALDAARAHEPAEGDDPHSHVAPGASGWVDPTDEPEDPAQTADDGPDEGWEYPEPDPSPQGRQGRRRGASGHVREDSKAAAPAADRG